MLQVVKFHTDDPLRFENCVVMRNAFEFIEFGFPYYDALPEKLSVPQCMDLIQFIKACVNHLDDGGALSVNIRPKDSNVDQVIIVRKTFHDHFHIDFAFADVGPVMVPIQEVVIFSETLNKMLAIPLIEDTKEELL